MPRATSILINILAIFLIGFFLFLPQYKNFQELILKLQEKKAESSYKQEYYSNIKNIAEELEQYETELAKIDSALPLDSSLPSLFNFLNKASAENGLILKEIKSFKISSPTEGSRVKTIDLEISVGGSYPALKNFLSTLEKTARLIEVENISFEKKEKEEIFSFGLKLKTHAY